MLVAVLRTDPTTGLPDPQVAHAGSERSGVYALAALIHSVAARLGDDAINIALTIAERMEEREHNELSRDGDAEPEAGGNRIVGL